MSWLRGLKFKLMIILAIGSISLGCALYTGFDIKTKQAKSIANFVTQRIPIGASMGRATTDLNGLCRYLLSALVLDTDFAERTIRIDKAEAAIKRIKEELAFLKPTNLSEASHKILEDGVEKKLDEVQKDLSEVISKLKENKPEANLKARELLIAKVLPAADAMTKDFDQVGVNIETRNNMCNQMSIDDDLSATKTMTLMALLTTLFLWSLGLSIAYSISRKLQLVTEKVERSSEEVANSSNELAGGSQQLSSASQQQASSLEQSSASLQEITGMVESNLKNTEDSVVLVK